MAQPARDPLDHLSDWKSSSNGAELRTNLRSCLMSSHCEQESEAAAAGPGLRGIRDGSDGHFPGDKSCHGR